MDEHCYVYATLPATRDRESAKPLGFIAHMDTADDASGENVNPQIHPNYDGGKVVLPAHRHCAGPRPVPFLTEMKGQTLITTDGSTLLGADDKAGVAEIMTALERIIAENRPHGKLCIGFTPDEEIGEGASLFDVGASAPPTPTPSTARTPARSAMRTSTPPRLFVTVHGFSVPPAAPRMP